MCQDLKEGKSKRKRILGRKNSMSKCPGRKELGLLEEPKGSWCGWCIASRGE